MKMRSYPNETPEYFEARKRLLEQEIELRRMTEKVAAQRRALPPGGELKEDYVFETTEGQKVHLSELFGKHDTLALYSYMFGPDVAKPCPMCTGMLDGLNGSHPHISQRMSFYLTAESPAERLKNWKKDRGWTFLPLLSAAGNSYTRDYNGKSEDNPKHDTTKLNIFTRKDGKIRHFWGSALSDGPSDPGQDQRGLDIINGTFNMLDFSPEGRGKFYTKVEY